jgi:hypothetical protein
MEKYLLAATLIGAFVFPVLAMDSYYIVSDKTTKKCSMSRSAATETEKFRMMGTYGSEADAKMAMAGMTRCKH